MFFHYLVKVEITAQHRAFWDLLLFVLLGFSLKRHTL